MDQSITSDYGSSASSSSEQLPKVCIITGALVNGYPGHHLYIVNLNSSAEDGEVYLAAKVRDVSSALCVIGYRMYAFEAEDVDGFDAAGDRKHVYSHELSSSYRKVVPLQVQNLKEVCVMNATKFYPSAIASPDGSKIVVYASTIRKEYKKSLKRCDFELFNVIKEECKELPQLPPWKRMEETSIMALAAFKSGSSSVLLVLLENKVYSLDLDLDRWEALSSVFENSVPMGMGSPLDVIGDNICLTPYGAYHLGNPPGRSFTYPNLSEPEISGPLYPILLDHTNFCIVNAGLDEDKDKPFSATPYYAIDVYNCDLNKLKQQLDQISKKNKEEEALPGTTKSKPFHFSLEKGDAFLLSKCRFASIPNPQLKAKTT